MSKTPSEPENTADEESTAKSTEESSATSSGKASSSAAKKSSAAATTRKAAGKTVTKDKPSSKGKVGAKDKSASAGTRSALRGRLGSGDRAYGERPSLITPRFVIMVALIVAGVAYIVMTWRALGATPLETWSLYDALEEPKTRRWVWELDLWNYAIGFGAILVGLIIGAHRSTPLGRGNGVVVGMLACFGIGLLWICTFYLFADNITDIWVLGALGQWNLVVGIAFMAVGFSYATKWE
ncbi:cell division protein CrgA [Nocardioides zeae]|uniref:Cell division protein CrgA n=1 Tax=Nocardioides imazamoxiresistens TaxID=3231893 RepID=A0ABU3PUY7_9ACTN|nr:cell division protein CrgA [Nocardioides zeae]MDT9593036.1 cell division protein CrgA [Nocardioides zeae]